MKFLVAAIAMARGLLAADPSPEAVKRTMIAKYPGWGNDFIFGFSESVRAR